MTNDFLSHFPFILWKNILVKLLKVHLNLTRKFINMSDLSEWESRKIVEIVLSAAVRLVREAEYKT